MSDLNQQLQTIREWVYRHNRKPEIQKYGIMVGEMEELLSLIRRLLEEQAKPIWGSYGLMEVVGALISEVEREKTKSTLIPQLIEIIKERYIALKPAGITDTQGKEDIEYLMENHPSFMVTAYKHVRFHILMTLHLTLRKLAFWIRPKDKSLILVRQRNILSKALLRLYYGLSIPNLPFDTFQTALEK